MGNSVSATRNEQVTTTSKQRRQQESNTKQPLSEQAQQTDEYQHQTLHSEGAHTKRSNLEQTRSKSANINRKLEEFEIGRKSDERSAASSNRTQRIRQPSAWSFGSLSGRLNWSFSGGANRNSFHNRNKSTRRSLTSAQQRRSKTQWHKPLTNAIFSSHFKEASRNEQFRIVHLVAKGAFGVVFKVINKHYTQELQEQQSLIIVAQKQNNGKTSQHPAPVYALKVLKKSKIIEENSVQQIKDEADIQKLCGHHPFIVQQVDLWQNRRNLHIQYVPNGELFSKITHFSLDLIRLYLAEIALAIDFLHNAGVIYRDVKPENILVNGDFHLKLTDFGLSKWLRLGATTRTMCGTFQYMAPEVLRGEPYGHAADWWSLGILACQMLIQTSPDIRTFLDITLPSTYLKMDLVDHVTAAPTTTISKEDLTNNFLAEERNQQKLISQNFLPPEVEELPHEAKDVLKRLLEVEPKQRVRSVLSLQKIALYKNFKIDAKHLLKLRPIEMVNPGDVAAFMQSAEDDSAWAEEQFQKF